MTQIVGEFFTPPIPFLVRRVIRGGYLKFNDKFMTFSITVG